MVVSRGRFRSVRVAGFVALLPGRGQSKIKTWKFHPTTSKYIYELTLFWNREAPTRREDQSFTVIIAIFAMNSTLSTVFNLLAVSIPSFRSYTSASE
eukprot:scaffold1953_cov176-Amphora_coffeaeformis.AAC.17